MQQTASKWTCKHALARIACSGTFVKVYVPSEFTYAFHKINTVSINTFSFFLSFIINGGDFIGHFVPSWPKSLLPPLTLPSSSYSSHPLPHLHLPTPVLMAPGAPPDTLVWSTPIEDSAYWALWQPSCLPKALPSTSRVSVFFTLEKVWLTSYVLHKL